MSMYPISLLGAVEHLKTTLTGYDLRAYERVWEEHIRMSKQFGDEIRKNRELENELADLKKIANIERIK